MFASIYNPVEDEKGTVPENYNCLSFGVNIVGIIRAPCGDGKEAIVLITPYNYLKITRGEALSLGSAYAMFSLFSRVTWLSNDIIWLTADSRHGEYTAVASWMRDFHAASFGDLMHSETCAVTALVIKVADRSTEFEKDALTMYAEASNGQMPNLDLINVVSYLAVHGQGY
ncbi:glycosylphosphatidylinositol anchor attachment 1 [Olea europaea subsp. europaea]|uniref:Glycosylphosphatidylinositol anchor attachment 1 n=1 Tax=Olea europaea subsp. europaea TaxID=158383 RepID=A0A8S0RL59_OLEEU|nr:glycosylphosphatidylinositol anchor attachment 1 [Olea europaea subsp. europaea]